MGGGALLISRIRYRGAFRAQLNICDGAKKSVVDVGLGSKYAAKVSIVYFPISIFVLCATLLITLFGVFTRFVLLCGII